MGSKCYLKCKEGYRFADADQEYLKKHLFKKEQLHKQIHYYSERFEDFNDTLSKSNEAISG